MSTNAIATPFVWISAGLVSALASLNAAAEPDRLWAYIIAGGFVPVAIVVLMIASSFGKWQDAEGNSHRVLRHSLLVACAVLAASLLFNLAQGGGLIAEDASDNWLTGLILAVGWVLISLSTFRPKKDD